MRGITEWEKGYVYRETVVGASSDVKCEEGDWRVRKNRQLMNQLIH